MTTTTLDPQNRAQVISLIRRADAKFRLSAKAWEDGNNSGDAAYMEAMSKRELRLAKEGADLLAPLGITCDWPGLYPSFQVEVKGRTVHDYTTLGAVLTALDKPRNWIRENEVS